MNPLLLFSSTSAAVGNACSLNGGGFLGFPTWYKYLKGQYVYSTPGDTTSKLVCSQAPHLTSLSDLWLIIAAVIEILLRVAALAAVAFVIYGGITFITSEGDPEKTKEARNTMINALVGLAIAVMAAAIIAFIAGSIS